MRAWNHELTLSLFGFNVVEEKYLDASINTNYNLINKESG